MISLKAIIKRIINSVLHLTVRNKKIRTLYKYLGYYSFYYEERITSKLLSPDQTVLNGPFKGLKYPKLESSASSLITKIIGSYENELEPTFLEFFKNDYKTIIDIGCAEGYYAVGLALKFPKAKVIAFDTDAKAREKCRSMAVSNGVANQVSIHGSCDAKTLVNLNLSDRSLIISDCEGFETELFTEESLMNLNNCDLIIELHDHIKETISTDIMNLFIKSHQITMVQSTYDKRIKEYLYSIPNGVELFDRDLSERAYISTWAVLKSNKY